MKSASMPVFCVSACALSEKEKAHVYLKDLFSFPAYYGKNLDALYDCLTELGPCRIRLEGFEKAAGYALRVQSVILEAAEDNKNIKIMM